jgi:hypothetical protein
MAKAKKAKGGRPVIYGPKADKKYRILSLTKVGSRQFEKARAALKKEKKWRGRVSDADVVDFLVRVYAGLSNEDLGGQ